MTTRLRLVGKFQIVAVKDRPGPKALKQPRVFDFDNQRVLVMHASSEMEAQTIAEGLRIAGYEVQAYDLKAEKHI